MMPTDFGHRLCILLLLLVFNVFDCNNSRHDLKDIFKHISADHLSWLDTPIDYKPLIEMDSSIWTHEQSTISKLVDSMHRPPKHAFDHLIGNKHDIELYINENDSAASIQWVDGFQSALQHTVNVTSDWYRLQTELGGKSKLIPGDDFDDRDIEINGFHPDSYFANLQSSGGRQTTGVNGEFFTVRKQCIALKGCNVYPHWRVLHKSPSRPRHSFSCADIMTRLMPPIYECVHKYGRKCPLILAEGNYRIAFKLNVTNTVTNRPIVVRILRPQEYNDYARVMQESVRESMLLYYLRQEEQEYIARYGAQFVSTGEPRAFPFVRELGHCVYPSFISVTFYYGDNLSRFVRGGVQATVPLRQLMAMSLDVAKGVELVHNVRGGPFTHADVHITQFMIDDDGRVLINDFNRGRIAKYRFAEDFESSGRESGGPNGVLRCRQCPYWSPGKNRSPEELAQESEDEYCDIYSTAGVIHDMFTGTLAWHKAYHVHGDGEWSSSHGADRVDHDHIPYLVHHTYRRPHLPSNMPYAVKELLWWAWTQNKEHRPNARQFRQRLQEIYDNLDHYTQNQSYALVKKAWSKRLFANSNPPKAPSSVFFRSDESNHSM